MQYTYTNVTSKEKEALNCEQGAGGNMGGFDERKGERNGCDFIIISK